MKRSLLTLIFMLGFAGALFAQNPIPPILFMWEHDTVNTVGYELSRFEAILNDDGSWEVPVAAAKDVYEVGVISGTEDQQALVENIPAGTWAFSVRAYNVGIPEQVRKRSDPSNYAYMLMPGDMTTPQNYRIVDVPNNPDMMAVIFSAPQNRAVRVHLEWPAVAQMSPEPDPEP